MPGKYSIRYVIRELYILFLIAALLQPGLLISSAQNTDFRKCGASYAVSDKNNYVYANLRDINIGGFIEDTTTPNNSVACYTLHLSTAIALAVKLVNKDPRLLPNVSLGFVLFRDVYELDVAVARALQFHPHVSNTSEACQECFSKSNSVQQQNLSRSTDNHVRQYDVIGVISSSHYSMAVPVSYILSAAKIPLIACAPLGEDFSDKSRHPFFMWLIGRDLYPVEAMLTFIRSNGWTYVSVLFSTKESYNIYYRPVKYLVPRYNIYIATAYEVNERSNFDSVVIGLTSNIKSRVRILLLTYNEVIHLFTAINRQNVTGTFIYVFVTSTEFVLTNLNTDLEKHMLGAFIVISNKENIHPELYQELLKHLTNSTMNPWLKPCLECMYRCSFSEGTCYNKSKNVDARCFGTKNTMTFYMDAVMVFAYAATKLLAELCPELTGREARACIHGDVLLKYMRNVSIEGYSGHIEFDAGGDRKMNFKIIQLGMSLNPAENNTDSISGLALGLLAFYNSFTKQLLYTGEKISWDHLRQFSNGVNNPNLSTQQSTVPESVCSKHCQPGEQIILKNPHCCWECRKCKNNEKLASENTECVECGPFTWPDPDTHLTTCKDIPVTFMPLSNPLSVTLISLGVVAAISAMSVSLGFLHFRELPIIKASSMELSFLQLVASAFGCFPVVQLQLPPSDGICSTLYFLFTMSDNLGPMIVCVATYIIYKPAAHKSQPVAAQKYVELTCDMTLQGLASFLTFNLALVFACSVLAFKTRNLPDNFNESWFIFMCVATTLIIWLGFVPTYFTASRGSIKTLKLSLAILLNHTVLLVFLFIPRLYAAVRTSAEIEPATHVFVIQPTTSGIKNAKSAQNVLLGQL